MNTQGGSGPSGLDADGWRHILISRNYGSCSVELRSEFALMIKQICIEKVELFKSGDRMTSSLEAFLACRLLPLDKNPGLRPIGVGEVLRRIAGKVIMNVIKGDIQEAAGSIQVCAGQPGGCEAAIHAMRSIYEDTETDAVLLIDAANAFNAINRKAMLENIRRLCPIAYVYAYNCYAAQARLFVIGGKEIASKEGTTQGDPPSMAFYAIGLTPMLSKISETRHATTNRAKHVAYADDLTGGGKLDSLRSWFDNIVDNGPMYGYDAEPTKSWLIVKPDLHEQATHIFEGTGVNITTRGKKHLGAVIGEFEHKHEFITDLVDRWVKQINMLANIAAFEPQASYAAFTNCLRHQYTFYMRTIPGISELLQPLELAIRHRLIPAITEGRMCTDDERILFSLPVRLGGMGIINPMLVSDDEHTNSKIATESLTNAIIIQQTELPANLHECNKAVKSVIRTRRRNLQQNILDDVRSRMPPEQKRANKIACEMGSSNWLSTLPLEEKGFLLTKREFWDAVNLRYSWSLTSMPTKCACGAHYDISHAFSCKKGGFVTQRHNELRDLTGNLLAEVCRDVCIEPPLNMLTGESLSNRTANISDEARLDISARDVWTKGQRAFFDIRVFDPKARRYNGQTISQAYRVNENEKKRAYNERVLQVEHGSFTPLVFCAMGGMAPECSIFYKRLSHLIAEKRNEKLSLVSTWVRTKISFALLRSALLCIRGTRSRYYKTILADTDMDVDMKESTIRAF